MVKLFLVQDGVAAPKEIDRERPLGNTDRHDVEHVAAFLAGAGVGVTAIFHSGKKRAQQTDEIPAERVQHSTPPKQPAGINPLDPVEALGPRIDE